MNKKETGELLYLFYRKRSSSFLANIYKASITAETRDIHRARLDVKKIFALYGLLEILNPDAFSKKTGDDIFMPLYQQAGKIREMQVNFLLLTRFGMPDETFRSFGIWLIRQEKNALKQFIRVVQDFREKDLEDAGEAIKNICYSNSARKIFIKTEAYFLKRAEKICSLQAAEPGEKELHKIRKNLKAMSTIAVLAYSVKARNRLDMIITGLNKSEMMIGDWHDHVVLKAAIDRFLKSKSRVTEAERNNLTELRQKLVDTSQNLVLHFMPEVSKIVETILAERKQ